MRSLPLFLVLYFMSHNLHSNNCISRIYVSSAATSGQQDGSSWSDAYLHLQNALNYVKQCPFFVEVWVAGGTYRPIVDISGSTSIATPQNRTFHLDRDIRIYGGFAGHETAIHQRIKYLNPTILTGDQSEDDIYIEDEFSSNFPADNRSDNSYNIMRMNELSESTVLDGLVFRGGNAVHGSTFSKRVGAAIWNDGRGTSTAESIPNISNCIFAHCFSTAGGGAVYNYGVDCKATPSFSGCEFKFNFSQGSGGAVHNFAQNLSSRSSPSFKNCVFYKNFSNDEGGAVYSSGLDDGHAFPNFRGCTIVGNGSLSGGAIKVVKVPSISGNIQGLINTIFHNNTTLLDNQSFNDDGGLTYVIHSIYPEASPTNQNSNLAVDPLFVSSDNLRLSKLSPAIDAGEAAPPVIGGGRVLDLDQNARIMGKDVDIGAYEYLSCPSNNVIFVNDDQYNGSPTGTSPNFALNSLNAALTMACDCPDKPEIQVSEGNYIPHRLAHMAAPPIGLERTSLFYPKCPIVLKGGYSNNVLGGTTGNPTIINGDRLNNDLSSVNSTLVENVETLIHMDLSTSGSVIQDVQFANAYNEDLFLGSGVFVITTLDSSIFEIEIKNCEFEDNLNAFILNIVAGNLGHGKISIDSTVFTRNDSHWGVIYLDNFSSEMEFDLSNTTIQGNDATNSIVYIDSESDKLESYHITHLDFEENVSGEHGIFLRINGNDNKYVTIDQSDFDDNEASSGGAIYADLGPNTNFSILNTLFNLNRANVGGALYLTSSFENNAPTIKNSVFRSNHAESSVQGVGGAIYLEGRMTPKVYNSTFIDNSSSMGGGAIYSDQSFGSPLIWNSIFWNNTQIGSINSIESSGSTNVNLGFCLLQEPDCSQSHMTNVNCTTPMILGQDPMLESSGADRFTPLPGSPAIDKGSSATSEQLDYLAKHRIINNRIDVGAVEYQGAACVEHIVLDPADPTFGASFLNGAWEAGSSITVKPGLVSHDWTLFDAPEVILEGDYVMQNNSLLEIRNEGCNR